MSKRLLILLLLSAVPLSFTTSVHAEEVDDVTADAPATKTLVWPDGTRYVGGVVDGKRSGKGTIFWQDGTRFVGQFEDDMRNGPGTMILPDGTVYTGFFQNDELVDTQSTLAAANATETVEMDEASTSDALEDTELPMEADSLGDGPVLDLETSKSSEFADEVTKDVPEVAIEAADPEAEATPEAETSSVEDDSESDSDSDSMLSSGEDYTLDDPYASEVTEVTDAVEEELKDTINLWAAAWQEQNVPQYLANYSTDFAVPGRTTRRAWEALRRSRLNRPSFININVDYQQFELVEPNIVDVYFRQAYRSNTYSDLTEKVLRMRKEDTDWKILVERSR